MTDEERFHEDLAAACDFIEHYHLDHTRDELTRLKGEKTDIIIVSDGPEQWREKLREFLKDAFPKGKKRRASEHMTETEAAAQ